MKIIVAARQSSLSQAQLVEMIKEMKLHHPNLEFVPHLVATKGDKDHKTSLRILDKTDFFTKEVDELLLTRKCRIAVHSAKDLPEPPPKGLRLIALTEGVDPSDVLVLREGDSFESLRPGANIATSSIRREEAVKKLRGDLSFVDIRGTIEERLEKLFSEAVDGVVIAEAALIRLNLKHLNRLFLPGETTPLQGQLAVVARQDDEEMLSLFHCVDSRI